MERKEENRIKLGKNLFNIREKACLNTSNLSDLSTVSKSTIFRIENEKTNFKLESLIKIIEVFGITLDELFNLKIEDYTEDELQKRIEKFRKKYKHDSISAADLKAGYIKFKGLTFHVNKLVADGFFDIERSGKEVREEIFTNDEVIYNSTEITNCLKSKPYLTSIVINKNLKKYRLNKPRDNKNLPKNKK